MLSAPGQNWTLYEEKCRAEHVRWLQGLTPTEGLAIYASLFDWAAAHASDDERAQMEYEHWQEKLALRERMRTAFAELDRFRHGKLDSPDAGRRG